MVAKSLPEASQAKPGVGRLAGYESVRNRSQQRMCLCTCVGIQDGVHVPQKQMQINSTNKTVK